MVTPESRGPDGNYTGLAAPTSFEAMADVAAHYRLDPSRAALTGYSMGGIGTFQLGEQFPDLFGKAFSTSGTDDTGMPGNLRNLPILMWNMVADEEVPIDGPEQTAKRSMPTATATSWTSSRPESTTRSRSTTNTVPPPASLRTTASCATPRT